MTNINYNKKQLEFRRWRVILNFVSLFNGVSTLVGYIMPKPSFSKNWEDKRIHTLPKGICPKMNIIARLEFELAYNDFAIQCFNHYTMSSPRRIILVKIINKKQLALGRWKIIPVKTINDKGSFLLLENWTLAWRLECSPMAQETWVQS